MPTASGTIDGGDQESNRLIDSIRENTEKLGNLTKILSGDSSALKEMRSRADEVASSEIQTTGRKFALQQQAQLDRLAANNFRATETIISELLSRFGGTSFYPALSAFRVARESVAVGTGKTQSELDVMDILNFVNDSSKEVFNDILKSFGQSIGLIRKPVNDFNQSFKKTNDVFVQNKRSQEEALPNLRNLNEELEGISEEGVTELDFVPRGGSPPPGGNQPPGGTSGTGGVSPEAMKAARTAAGIAGLGVTAILLTNNLKQLSQAAVQTGTAMKTAVANAFLTPGGTTSVAPALGVASTAAKGFGAGGGAIGTAVGTALGGPLGAVIGSAVGGVIGSTVGMPIQAAVSILTSIEQGISQIADDLVGFSPEVTNAMIEKDLALLNDDMRRANQIGSEVARLTAAQTNLQLASRRAFDTLVEITEPILTVIANSMSIMLNYLLYMKTAFDIVVDKLGMRDIINLVQGAVAGIDLLADLLKPPQGDFGNMDDILNVRPDQRWIQNNLNIRP